MPVDKEGAVGSSLTGRAPDSESGESGFEALEPNHIWQVLKDGVLVREFKHSIEATWFYEDRFRNGGDWEVRRVAQR